MNILGSTNGIMKDKTIRITTMKLLQPYFKNGLGIINIKK